MEQVELNRQIARQLRETVGEIARRGFSLVHEVPDEPVEMRVHKDEVDTTLTVA